MIARVRVPCIYYLYYTIQSALLLATIATRIGYSFSNYRIIPMGSYSKIARLGQERTAYELYSSGGKFFRGSFNTAMVSFLQCLDEIGKHVEGRDRAFTRLPYQIVGDKIGNLSIKLSGQEEAWTKALKYMLTNLKWLLAWCGKLQR